MAYISMRWRWGGHHPDPAGLSETGLGQAEVSGWDGAAWRRWCVGVNGSVLSCLLASRSVCLGFGLAGSQACPGWGLAVNTDNTVLLIAGPRLQPWASLLCVSARPGRGVSGTGCRVDSAQWAAFPSELKTPGLEQRSCWGDVASCWALLGRYLCACNW